MQGHGTYRQYIARGFAAPGFYWREALVMAEAAYVPTDELIITVCGIEPDRNVEDFYSEFDRPSVEEFRLLAALDLAVAYDNGMIRLQPLSSTMVFNTQQLHLEDAATLDYIRSELTKHWEADGSRKNSEGPYPPYQPGSYHFRPDKAPVDLQRRLFDAIDLNDHVLTRGLRCLLRASMLAAHPFYAEEAIYPLHAALDASHSIFKRQMAIEGVPNASAKDVAHRFETLFGVPKSGEAYFADYYVDRVMTQHPLSRYGATPYIPATYGEVLWLYKDLRELFRYFVLGEVVK